MNQRNDELMHYGVLGMKWGVRRNARVLSNHRRNEGIKDVKEAYKSGKISRSEKRRGIKQVKSRSKTDLKTMNRTINKSHGSDLKQVKKNIAKQTLSEVPHSTLKKGLTTLNKAFAVANVSGVAAGTAIGVAPALAMGGVAATAAVAALPLSAVGAFTIAGQHYLVQKMVLNKMA